MVTDNKDRLGKTLEHAEAAREDQWARQLDQELMARIRAKQETALSCPRCKKVLVSRVEAEVAVMVCVDGHGAWLEAKVMKTVLRSGRSSEHGK